jgi:ABC-type antimicrobial peptide transport system permease subunit
MRAIDIVTMSLRSLLRRKVRTLLTVIGVVVGTTAIMVMISLGIGMNESLDAAIANMGDLTVIKLEQYVSRQNPNGEYTSSQNTLNAELVEKIRALDGVLAVTPYLECWNYSFMMSANKRYRLSYCQLVGVDPSALSYIGINLKEGEMPSADDKEFALFGSEIVYEFRDPNKQIRDWFKEYYNSDGTRKPPKVNVMTSKNIYSSLYMSNWVFDPVTNMSTEKVTKTKQYPIKHVAIMDGENSTDYRANYCVFISLDMMQTLIKEAEKINKVKKENSVIDQYTQIIIKAKDIKAADAIQKAVKEMGVTTYGLSDIREEMQKSQSMLQYILLGIGAMSLVVAAVGIANTMVMSIYERTREIGVMKVLGCPLGSIKSMFLFEAAVIGLAGGAVGVGLSFAASYVLNNFPEISSALGSNYGGGDTPVSVIPFWLIIVAVIFGTIVGLISGYFPARRATKISALEAIKNEN